MIESPYLDKIISEEVERRTALWAVAELSKLTEEPLKKAAQKLAENRVNEAVDLIVEVLVKIEILKRMHRAIKSVLKVRFGPPPTDITGLIEKVTDDDELDSLNAWAGTCPDLESFRHKLTK